MFLTLLHTSSSFYGDTCSKTLKMSTGKKYISSASYPGTEEGEFLFLPLPPHLHTRLHVINAKMYTSVEYPWHLGAVGAHSLLPSYLPSFLLLAELDGSQLQKPQVANCMHGYQIHLMCQNISIHFWVLFSLFSVSILSCCCRLRNPTFVSLPWRASGSSWERYMIVIVCEVMWGHMVSHGVTWCYMIVIHCIMLISTVCVWCGK